MALPFDANDAPFNRLSLEELEIVRDALDIGYFRPGETIIARDRAPESLFIVIKGSVEERDNDEVVALRGPGDSFDSRALVQGGGSNAFVAREETLCNLLPRDVTLQAHQSEPPLRLVLLPRHFAQARRHFARGGGGALRPADERTCRRSRPCAMRRSSTRPIRFNERARGCGK